MSTLAPKSTQPADVSSRMFQHTCRALSAGACSAILAGTMLLGGGWPSSLAYADGYVDGSGNNVYYGFKTDASYTEGRFHIEVTYYDTLEHAKDGGDQGQDPLGKFVRVHYLSNCNKEGGTADDWRFRPMWWYGVPKGLQNVQNITYTRVEKLTNQRGNQPFRPAGSSQFIFTDGNGYGVVSHKTYQTPEDWKGISNFYFKDDKVLASKGWKQLLGLNGGTYDNVGNTAGQWESYQKETDGLQGIFVDWESAGQRFYDMTYVGEMTKEAWENRDKNPLRFAAGVYRFAGNWHYAVGQKHDTPKIADNIDLKYPELTPVKDLKNVSTTEQKTIKEKIEAANKDTKYYSDLVDKVEVSDKGVATITFKDKTTRTISADLLVFKNEEDKDKYKPIMPARTPVVNPSKLTADDKTKVIAAFKTANKDNKDFNDHVKADPDGIKFNDDGTKLIVTYQDGSKIEIDASELVCQGATIADWAPYVVPDTIEVENLKQLSDDDVAKIIKAFDEANTGITPYDDAKNKNADKKAPVTVDPKTGNATITWEDGSTTTISAWQFLKEKAKQNPEPSTPTQQGNKTFIVEAPQNQSSVNFDPFNVKESDLTANEQALNSIKDVLKKCAAKDAKDSNTAVTIKSVEFKIEDGKGVVVFHADNYKDATYPMSVFLKQKADKQTSQTPSTETKTENGQDEHDTFTYKVTKTEFDGDKQTAQDALKALKQFVTDNYDNVSEADLSSITDSVTVKTTWTPKTGTKNMGPYGASGNNAGPMTSFSIVGDDFGIRATGHPWTDEDNGGDWSSSIESPLFTIKPSDLYVKKGNTQPSQDNTIDKLKEQAKALLKQRQDDGLTNDDLKRAGIKDPEKLSGTGEGSIDEIAKGQTAEKDLRDLIRKLTDAKKAERKYNPITEIEVTDPENLSEDDFKKAVEAFLKANYDGTDSLAVDKVPYTVPTSLKPKTDTVLMELASDTNATGISSITYANSDFKTLIFTDKNKNQLFTVPVTYKKKAETPAPTPDALSQMKKDAKQQIDRNPNLTKEQKEEYKKQIEQATTADKIKEILKKAAQQGKDNQNDPSKAQTITDNKGGGNAKKEAEKKQKEKEEEHNKQKLQDEKKKVSDKIDNLNNLTADEKNKLKEQINGTGTGQDPDGAKTPEEVQNILDNAEAINDAKGALQNDAAKGALPFLCHGDANSEDDKALKDLIGADPSKKDEALAKIDTLLKKTNPAATAAELKQAVAAAKQANARNEQAAKDTANKQLTAKKDALDSAYNALTEEQKKSAKEKYDAAINAINAAKESVTKATTPSQIKTALDKLKTAIDDANTAIENAKGKRDTSQNTNDSKEELAKEKKAQIERIKNSDLPEADKQKAIEDINNATKVGDPTGIADRALKAKKIADALAAIDKLTHLNDAQKKTYKDIVNGTDAGNHKDDDGNDTGVDDIDDALANAANTDDAMARLEKLKEIADKFAKGDKYKGLQDGDDKKKAFDNASTAAGAVLDKAKGDAKNADQVNDLYKDLLKAMQTIDPSIKGAGVSTDALSKEIEADKGLKPDDKADPKTPGDPLYTTASKDKKEAFDKALSDAEAALNKAKEDNENDKKQGTTPRTPEQEAKDQKAVDDALQKLEEARKALDGVNTKLLQDAVANADETHKSVKYTNASKDKRDAYDKAVEEGKALLEKLNGTTQAQPGQGGQQPGGQGGQEQKLDTKEDKQKALDAALKKIEDAKAALDGAAPMSGYPLIAVIPSGSVDNGNAQAPATQPDNTGAAAPSTDAAPAAPGASAAPSADANTTANASANGNASTEAGAAASAADSDESDAAAEVASSRTKGHGKHAGIAQTSDLFALGGLAAPFAALAGALSLGAAGSRKRLRSAKHLKR